jgi:AMIN domain
MRGIVQLNLVLLLVSIGAAQIVDSNAAVLRKIRIARDGGKVKLEVTLTTSVVPTVITATDPDRLVLQLPNTVVNAKQHRITVNKNGVNQVRVGLNSADPPVTRVVVDLDRAHPYGFATAGNTITLTVLPTAIASTAGEQRGTPVAAANRPLIGRLWHRRHQAAQSDTSESTSSADDASGTNGGPKRSSSFLSAHHDEPPTKFKVKYVAEGAAYLNGGRRSGLAEGMKLFVRDSAPSSDAPSSTAAPGEIVAELQVVSVAATSAVTEIHAPKRDVRPGDWAYLSAEDAERLAAERSLSATRKLPQISTLRESSSTGEKGREGRSHAPSPEESRIRGRIGLDYSGIRSSSMPASSGQVGLAFRTDMTHIAGTYWNLQGYWRGRLTNNSQPNEETMQDYLDKTYTIQLYYDNPNSKWLAGFGRLYLPWAVSLDTIDGGYLGRRVAKGVIAGIFAGSTPDPASWHYNPDRRIGGSFVNFEGGSYEDLHYSSTAGVALSTLKWQLDRPYLFLENELSFKRLISVYHSFIVDDPQGIETNGIKPGAGISRSYLTLHIQPHQRISFDVYHNYFRDVPTAATQLIGTGLVDKLLYQGVNVGVRVEPVRHIFLYSTIGQSDKTGDAKRALNRMYGLAWNDIWHTGIRADARYSKFDSSFARGNYRVLTLSRHLGDRMLWDAQVGRQSLASPFTANNRSLFLDTSFDTNITGHSYLQSGYTINRGSQLNYDQWYISLGYRFDVRQPAKEHHEASKPPSFAPKGGRD